MKQIHPGVFFICACMMLLILCSRNQVNRHYPVNTPPLHQTAYVSLPLGAVKPRGWLEDQLRIMADGLTGHLDEFWPDLIHSAWKGGDGESWERGPYYLDGLVPLAYILADQRLIDKTKPWIESILDSGRPDGWFGPEQNEDRWPLAVALKVLAQYYEATDDARALKLIADYFEYLNTHPPDWPDKAWRGVRAMENAVTGYWLYRRTGRAGILDAVRSIRENSYDWPKALTDFPWDSDALRESRIPRVWDAEGLTAHVVNVAMAVKYPGIWYQQSDDAAHKNAVFRGITNLDHHHGQLAGRFSGDEHLSGMRPTQGTELCAVVEYMFSLENLFEIIGDNALADRLESLAYNALPGTMTPDGWTHQYDQQTNQVLVSDAPRDWSSNGNTSNVYGLMPNYPCCLANLHQGWPKFVKHMWMASHDNGLAAVAYGPCTVSARVGRGVEATILEETDYPFRDSISMTVTVSRPAAFPVYLRIPGWAENARVVCSGDTLYPQAGATAAIRRRWQTGDRIQLTFPMKVRTEERANGAVAVRRGPLFFALRIGKKFRKITLQGRAITSIDTLGSVDWEIRPTTPWNVALCIDPQDPGPDITVSLNPIRNLPFSDTGDMAYDRRLGRHQPWPHEAPVILKAQACRIPHWRLQNNSAGEVPSSPVNRYGNLYPVSLVPYGCARLRIAEFPWTEPQGGSRHE